MDRILDSLLNTTADVALRRRAKWIIKNLSLKKRQRILDLGCGDGFYLHLLSNLDLDLDLYGSDYDKKALESAKKKLNTKKIKLIQADLMKKLPFPNNYFDGVVLSEVIEHLPDDAKGTKEVLRILKRNGRIALSVPHINYPFLWDPINWLLQRIFNTHIKNGFWAGIWNQHLRLYSVSELKTVLEMSGFKNVKIAKLTSFVLPFNHHLINFGARILANKTTPEVFKKRVSKFSPPNKESKRNFSPFSILFKFDTINDDWNGEGGAVSLVASATK